MIHNAVSPHSVVANYTPQRIPRFKGNPLIEALPPSLTDDQLFAALSRRPDFSPQQRSWTNQERILLLQELSSFIAPLSRHVELARTIEAMLRNGYVGRSPRTPENAHRLQSIYEMKSTGQIGGESLLQSPGQASALLMGAPGMGKTTIVRHVLSLNPQVIFHPDYNLYQVTYLHVEMPSDGSSLKGLAEGILTELDRVVPGANHFDNLALRGRPGADSLIKRVARALHMHHVGILVADETQNLANAHKGKQTVMTELVSMCNILGIPMLLLGTNKCQKVFSLDFRQTRRAAGRGLSHWDRLRPAASPGEVDEWDDFLKVLWCFQWVRKPAPLDAQFRTLMYHYSQGIIDTAIKLFVSAQVFAILNGSETITPAALSEVYKQEFTLLHPMLDALRSADPTRLAAFDDIAPVGVEQMLEDVRSRVKAKRSSAHSLLPKDEHFETGVATALVASGFGEEEALDAAAAVARDANVKNLADATAKAINTLRRPRRAARGRSASAPTNDGTSNGALGDPLASRPQDYRNAISGAREQSTTVHEQLLRRGMVRPLQDLLDLN